MIDIQNLTRQIQEVKDRRNLLDYDIKNKQNKLNEISKNIKTIENTLKLSEDAIVILNQLVFKTRGKAISFIEELASRALKDIFNKDIQLKLLYNTTNTSSSIKVKIVENGNEFDPLTARGLGLSDVVSFVIQLCIKIILGKKYDLPMILDERFKFLNDTGKNDFNNRMYRFLKDVREEFKMQIIMVTGRENKDAMQFADKIIYVENKGGKSIAKNE